MDIKGAMLGISLGASLLVADGCSPSPCKEVEALTDKVNNCNMGCSELKDVERQLIIARGAATKCDPSIQEKYLKTHYFIRFCLKEDKCE